MADKFLPTGFGIGYVSCLISAHSVFQIPPAILTPALSRFKKVSNEMFEAGIICFIAFSAYSVACRLSKVKGFKRIFNVFQKEPPTSGNGYELYNEDPYGRRELGFQTRRIDPNNHHLRP
jgi:hypothetical protein